MFRSAAKPYKNQKYSDIRKERQSCGKLFEDPEFPPNSASLSYKGDADSSIVWKRPGELVSDPKLFIDGAGSEDFAQGELGNCWFVAACAGIAEDQNLWKKVVPDYKEQEFGDGYAGIFHFQFFRFGEWIDVVIDDYLPSRGGDLVYCHSRTKEEFWSALLEKAYAKLFGDYASLEAGKARDALVDMMGGVGQGISISEIKDDEDKKNQVFKETEEAMENHSLMSASISAGNGEIEAKLDCGLVKGHAYTITKVKEVRLGEGLKAFFKNEKMKLVRLRNPWGGKEWTGPWSDTSTEWNMLSDSEKKDMDLTARDDGEFWMTFDDFCKYFTDVDICHIINTSLFSFKTRWYEDVFVGDWCKPHRCGGCSNHDTHFNNPQFVFNVNDDEEDVIISLEQEDKRVDREQGKKNDFIGFAIWKTKKKKVPTATLR